METLGEDWLPFAEMPDLRNIALTGHEADDSRYLALTQGEGSIPQQYRPSGNDAPVNFGASGSGGPKGSGFRPVYDWYFFCVYKYFLSSIIVLVLQVDCTFHEKNFLYADSLLILWLILISIKWFDVILDQYISSFNPFSACRPSADVVQKVLSQCS